MDIEYLCEFTVIAKLESFSRAAEELCISQSSLSKHILTLERELGVPLLVRNSRNVTLSPAGAQILPMAAQVYELKNKIMVAAAKQSSRQKTILSIASIPVMAQYDITGILARFQRDNPQITLDVLECERQELQELLLRAGFGWVRQYGERKMRPPAENEERIFFVAENNWKEKQKYE